MVIIGVISLLVVCVGIITMRLVYLSSPTKGEMIVKYGNPKSALLVMDIQNDTLGVSQYSNTDALIKNINDTVEYADKNNIEVIYIKQEFDNPLDSLLSGGMYRVDSEGAQLSKQLSFTSENVYSKNRSDTFSVSEFEKYLIDEQIDTLYLVGADASACVYKTALGGVNRGYNIIVLEDCIFSLNRDMLNNMFKKYVQNDINISNISSFIN